MIHIFIVVHISAFFNLGQISKGLTWDKTRTSYNLKRREYLTEVHIYYQDIGLDENV